MWQKSCNVFFRHSNKKCQQAGPWTNQPMMQVMVTTYWGVVLTDDLSCAEDVERAKLAFYKQFHSIYHKVIFVGKKLL